MFRRRDCVDCLSRLGTGWLRRGRVGRRVVPPHRERRESNRVALIAGRWRTTIVTSPSVSGVERPVGLERRDGDDATAVSTRSHGSGAQHGASRAPSETWEVTGAHSDRPG